MKKCILVVDCPEEEISPFYKELSSVTGKEFELCINEKCITFNKSRTGIKGELQRYYCYFATALRLFWNRKQYDLIVCWQQFYALIFCLYSRFFHVSKRNIVVACNYTYKEKKRFGRLYYRFMEYCMDPRYLDFICILSSEYAEVISKKFGYDKNRIIVTPFGISDVYQKYCHLAPPTGFAKNEYYFSVGRSNRDFDFLIRSWSGMPYKLVIASDTYKGTADNENVIIRKDISADQQYVWIANCKALIIPIDVPGIASGDTALLTGMSFEKIVIVTKPSTLSEMYIEDKVDGISIDKDKTELQKVVAQIENGELEYLKHNARKKYLRKYTREILAKNIAERLLESNDL